MLCPYSLATCKLATFELDNFATSSIFQIFIKKMCFPFCVFENQSTKDDTITDFNRYYTYCNIFY